MDLNKKLEELKPYQLNCNVFDVYSYNGLTMQDLLCQFFTKINECIKISNEVIDLVKWLVNEGLALEVAKKLQQWLEDGTLAELINEVIFKELNDKINILRDINVSIEDFGASTLLDDNTKAIQDAIEYVRNKGGGTIRIPKGTYFVKPKVMTIKLYSNINIVGEHKFLSVIKVHKDTGNWGEIFTHELEREGVPVELSNVTFKNFTMDCNAYNCPVNITEPWVSHRTFINGGMGYNFNLEDMRFISNGIWVIHTNSSDSTFINNEVIYDLSHYDEDWFDISAFWIGGDRNIIKNNLFKIRGIGTFSPESAIEFQGSDCICSNNIVDGFTNGIIYSPSTYTKSIAPTLQGGYRNIISNNILKVANKGVFIWPMNVDGYLDGLHIHNNVIYIDTDYPKGHNEPNAGIDIKLKTVTWDMQTPLKNIFIKDNVIEYKHRKVLESLYSADCGIKLYLNVDVSNMYIENNTIINCGGNGMVLHADINYNNWIKHITISKNHFINVKVPLYLYRNLEYIYVMDNTFEQNILYSEINDNMLYTILSNNETNDMNKNWKILNNTINCVDSVKPFYPIYDFSLISYIANYKKENNMLLDTNFDLLINELPSIAQPNGVIIPKNSYCRRLDGLVYGNKYNYPSTIGSLNNVLITQWINNRTIEVTNTSNIKVGQSLALDSDFFKHGVVTITSIIGNKLITQCNTHFQLKEGIEPYQVVGKTLNFYIDLVQVN